jgi:hypothetical protein
VLGPAQFRGTGIGHWLNKPVAFCNNFDIAAGCQIDLRGGRKKRKKLSSGFILLGTRFTF